MALTLEPNVPQIAVVGVPLCFSGSGAISIPQEDLQPINLPALGLNWTYTGSIFQKVSGTNNNYADCTATADPGVFGFRPFYFRAVNETFTTPGPPERNFSAAFFATDDAGLRYGIEILNYGGSVDQWKARLYWANNDIENPDGSVMLVSINKNDEFLVRSDGLRLYLERVHSCNPTRTNCSKQVMFSDILPSTVKWNFRIQIAYVNNKLHYVQVFKGTYQGTIPITWTVPLGGSLSGTDANKCFLSTTTGLHQVCIDSDFDETLCVDVQVEPLYFEPINYGCGSCVFTDEVVEFKSNGGLAGVLTVLEGISEEPSGTVIDALTWRAPSTPPPEGGHVILTYTIETDEGPISKVCHLAVVKKLEVINIEGDIVTGLVPGDSFRILTTYPYPHVVWENMSCPNIVTEDGWVNIPKTSNSDNCFGKLDCYIRGKLVSTEIETGCTNIFSGPGQAVIDLRIIVDPVYPTIELGGPEWTKWKPEVPEFRVISKTMEGGCSETHIRNRVPVQRWTVNYTGLNYEDNNPCDPVICCDDPAGFVGGIDPNTRVAKMLDDFWMLTAGEYGYFTLIDPKTGYVWHKVRFENRMERDHINWRTIQSRTLALIWNPCCATEPVGGVCPHSTVRTDMYPPSVPENLTVTVVSYSQLTVSWEPSIDNVGIDYYELLVDGELRRISSFPLYHHKGLLPLSSHSYKVQAVDFSGNPSGWTEEVIGTTLDHDVTGPSTPQNLRTEDTESTVYLTGDGSELVDVGVFLTDGPEDTDYSIQVTWDSVADADLAGYTLLVDGYAVDMGLATTYAHINLEECSEHYYYVRSYDTSGNKSRWSDILIDRAPCNEVFEGLDSVLEVTDTVIEV